MALDVLRIGLILVASRLLLACAGVFHERCGPLPEVSRKLLHVGMGMLALTYPWVFERAWPVVVLSGVYVVLVWASDRAEVLRRCVTPVVRGVRRHSYGEYCFPVVTAALFVLSAGDPVLYCAPLLLLTVADAAAAVVGERWGRRRYRVNGSSKSLEGSAAFFAVAAGVLVTVLPAEWGAGTLVVIAGAIASCATVAEAVCSRGTDNLVVPLVTFVALRLLAA